MPEDPASNIPLTVTLTYHGIELRAPQAGLREDRPLDDADIAKLQGWAKRHLVRARLHLAGDDELLRIGAEMADWLNGSTSALSRALSGITPPAIVEFRIERDDDSERARAFWDAPWELLALNGRHLALDDGVLLCPLRRLGKPQPPAPPSPNRLSLVFMAAARAGPTTWTTRPRKPPSSTRRRRLTLTSPWRRAARSTGWRR